MEKEKTEEGIGNQINFDQLFRVKGHQGLFTLRSSASKSGLIAVIGFMDYNNKRTVKTDQLECLGNLVFTTYAGHDDLKIGDVFNNIQKLNGDADMSDMVPNYDENYFKPYHARKVKMWYKIINDKLKEVE